MRKPVLSHMPKTKVQISLPNSDQQLSCSLLLIPIIAKSKISGLELVSAVEQANPLSLT